MGLGLGLARFEVALHEGVSEECHADRRHLLGLGLGLG